MTLTVYMAAALTIVVVGPGQSLITIACIGNIVCLYVFADCLVRAVRSRDFGWAQLTAVAFMSQIIWVMLMCDMLIKR